LKRKLEEIKAEERGYKKTRKMDPSGVSKQQMEQKPEKDACFLFWFESSNLLLTKRKHPFLPSFLLPLLFFKLNYD